MKGGNKNRAREGGREAEERRVTSLERRGGAVKGGSDVLPESYFTAV